MEKRLIITKRNEKILTCHFEGDTLLTVHGEEQSTGFMGNIYIGRVQTIVKNINSAFVEIKKGVNCYLSLDDVTSPFLCNREYNGKIVAGDEIAVQVIRDRIKTKDAVVSTNLSFPGRYAVVTTGNKKIGFSNKLSKQQKLSLKNECAPFFDNRFGYILRTNAGELAEKATLPIRQELSALTEQCENIVSTLKTRTVFSCLYETPPEYLLQIRDFDLQKLDKIITDDEKIYSKIKEFFDFLQVTETYKNKVILYQDSSYSLTNLVRLEKHITDALNKKVWLNCGGYLVIEQTEALTVVDVNSGKYTSKKALEETFLKINCEAAMEIAHQLRLRNLSGIIIIDFINMESKKNNNYLMNLLKKECRKDSIQTNVVDITPLGLVEVTRKRIYPSLTEQLYKKEGTPI